MFKKLFIATGAYWAADTLAGKEGSPQWLKDSRGLLFAIWFGWVVWTLRKPIGWLVMGTLLNLMVMGFCASDPGDSVCFAKEKLGWPWFGLAVSAVSWVMWKAIGAWDENDKAQKAAKKAQKGAQQVWAQSPDGQWHQVS